MSWFVYICLILEECYVPHPGHSDLLVLFLLIFHQLHVDDKMQSLMYIHTFLDFVCTCMLFARWHSCL